MIRNGAQAMIAAVMDCDKPVIAAVNGTAAGIGAHLAFACDLVIAAESASFVEVFVRRGLVPDGGGAYLLPRLIGLQKTKELMFFGDKLSAADAATIGLANRVVPDDELLKVAGEWAGRLASGPRSIVRDQVADQPLARQRPLDLVPRRGHRPGPEHDHRRRPGGRGQLRRAPRPRLQGLVAHPTGSPPAGRSPGGSPDEVDRRPGGLAGRGRSPAWRISRPRRLRRGGAGRARRHRRRRPGVAPPAGRRPRGGRPGGAGRRARGRSRRPGRRARAR